MNVNLEELRSKVEKIQNPGEIENVLSYDTPYNRFKQAVMEYPDQTVIKYMGRKFTYKEFFDIVENMAKGFYELGVRKDDVVTISMLGTPYGIASFYALDKIGACQHMVNSANGLEELKRELQNFDSKYFVANDIFCNDETLEMLKESGVEKVVASSLLDGMPNGFNYDKTKYTMVEKLKGMKPSHVDGKNILTMEQLLELGKKSDIELTTAEYEDNHMAAVAYTSGSTGQSKAVVVDWKAIDSFIQVLGMTEIGRYELGETLFDTFPLWIYYSLLNMVHEPICLGMAVGLDPIFEPKNLVRRNKQYQINHWPTIPPYVQQMAAADLKLDCSKWKVVSVGGVELRDDVKKLVDDYLVKHGAHTQVVQGYGASEVLGSFSYGYYDNPTPGTLGKPCIGNMIKFVDPETREDLGPAAKEGLLYLYSPAMMSGYYGDEESTKNSLIKDENGVVWYNTEDIMHLNERGELVFDDRLRRMTVTIGSDNKPNKLIPAKTEHCISGIPDVSSVAVITVPDEKALNKAVAYIVTKDGVVENETLRSNIIDFCSANIPEYQVPKDVVFIEEMPLTTSQKPDLKLLEAMYKEKNSQKEVNQGEKGKTLFKKNDKK